MINFLVKVQHFPSPSSQRPGPSERQLRLDKRVQPEHATGIERLNHSSLTLCDSGAAKDRYRQCNDNVRRDRPLNRVSEI
ncbi:hypothetical protein EVAR_66334_1 [Eumeta japonica]|uniref:Uncharacterized protein n=1 Tax=Eumeta variegata TaxID=151549 RepID=A0A4C1Z0D4_EUMVA|nr:hypothetical protein EVAR_66334_1 [Eumeta japonica]